MTPDDADRIARQHHKFGPGEGPSGWVIDAIVQAGSGADKMVESVTKLTYEPGDIAVVTVPTALNNEMFKAIKAHFETALPGMKCVVLTGGMKLDAVITPPNDRCGPDPLRFSDNAPSITDFLGWICERLVHVHHENANYDYMHRLKDIVRKIPRMELDAERYFIIRNAALRDGIEDDHGQLKSGTDLDDALDKCRNVTI